MQAFRGRLAAAAAAAGCWIVLSHSLVRLLLRWLFIILYGLRTSYHTLYYYKFPGSFACCFTTNSSAAAASAISLAMALPCPLPLQHASWAAATLFLCKAMQMGTASCKQFHWQRIIWYQRTLRSELLVSELILALSFYFSLLLKCSASLNLRDNQIIARYFPAVFENFSYFALHKLRRRRRRRPPSRPTREKKTTTKGRRRIIRHHSLLEPPQNNKNNSQLKFTFWYTLTHTTNKHHKTKRKPTSQRARERERGHAHDNKLKQAKQGATKETQRLAS